MVIPCPPCLRRLIDPPRCSRRHAVLLDGGHPERRNDGLCAGAIVARLYATYNPWFVQNKKSATHRASLVPLLGQLPSLHFSEFVEGLNGHMYVHADRNKTPLLSPDRLDNGDDMHSFSASMTRYKQREIERHCFAKLATSSLLIGPSFHHR
jgi:hypothetical protein